MRANGKARHKASLDRKLTRPLYTRDGQTISTLADAREYALKLPANYSARNHWQRAVELMLEAAEGGSVAAAWVQIHKTLFLDMCWMC